MNGCVTCLKQRARTSSKRPVESDQCSGSGNVALVLNADKGRKHLDLGFDVAYPQIPELAKLLGLGCLDR